MAQNYIANKRAVLPVKYDKSNYGEVDVHTDEVREQIDLSESTDSETEHSANLTQESVNTRKEISTIVSVNTLYNHCNLCTQPFDNCFRLISNLVK